MATYEKLGTQFALYITETILINKKNNMPLKKMLRWKATVVFTLNGKQHAIPFTNAEAARTYAKQVHEVHHVKTEVHLTQKQEK